VYEGGSSVWNLGKDRTVSTEICDVRRNFRLTEPYNRRTPPASE
jgi:hypothetical protein